MSTADTPTTAPAPATPRRKASRRATPAAAPAAAAEPTSASAAVEPVAQALAEPVAAVAAVAEEAPKASKTPKPAKPPKPADTKPKHKLVRDSFTLPKADFDLIAVLKQRALERQRPAKKSELLRAGLQALARLPAADLVAALEQLAPLKAGRPPKAG